MKLSNCLIIFCCLMFCVGGSVLADDLIRLTIANRYQADVVAGMVKAAHTRDGNDFIISVDGEQSSALIKAGIDFEILMETMDPARTFIARHADARPGVGVDVPMLGETVQLQSDVHIVKMSPSIALSLTRTTELTLVSLEDRSIPIIYLDPVISNTLSAVTDFPTDSLCDLVSLDSIYAMNVRLENFQTRYIFSDSIHAARDWMVQKFTDWGYTDISTPQYFYGNLPIYNVVVVKPGYAEPDKVIVIGGHYDAVTYGQPTDPMDYAPGADDDGSGTSITLEMARILADIPMRKTIIFIPFTAEEVGLYGSWYAAQDFFYAGTDIEVMFNYDMVGFNGNGMWQFEISSGYNTAYRDMQIATCNRVNSQLIPISATAGGSSDHASFMEFGFAVVNNIEEDFNYDGWHTDIDWTSRMDFNYMYEVARMSVASLGIVGNSAQPTHIEQIIDQGDGQSLELTWGPCKPGYEYSLVYGATSGVYTDTIDVGTGICSYMVTGLTEGQQYYFLAIGMVSGSYPSVYAVEDSETPYIVPRAPVSPVLDPDDHAILLDWVASPEADFDHYHIYRSIGGLPFSLFQDEVGGASYVDVDVIGQAEYHYKITAVDVDGYESDPSVEVSGFAGTFDAGILVIDETRQGGGMPTQETQEAFFTSLFDPITYELNRLESSGELLNRGLAGQYSSVFWFDDDFSPKLIRDSEDSLDWYAGFNGNLFISGFRTLEYWTPSPFSPGDFLFDRMRVSTYTVHTAADFAGATGVGGWPDIVVDSNSILGFLSHIPTLTVADGGEPIYLFDSRTDDPSSEGEVCAVYYDDPSGGKRVLLAFPLYFMTDESAIALVNYATNLFGETTLSFVEGDVDNSGRVDISDLVYMVDYMFTGGPAPLSMNSADVNGSCRIDVSDLVYMAGYFFLGGPAPLAGCVE